MPLRNNFTDGSAFTHTDQNDVANEVNGKVDKATLTAKGDLFVATASGAITNLAVGTNAQVLTADSTVASGIKWAAPTGGGGSGDVTLSGTQTLANKTIALGSNTVSGTTAQFNTALTDNDFATLAGTETLTNKTIAHGFATTAITGLSYLLASTSGQIQQYTGSVDSFVRLPNTVNAGHFFWIVNRSTARVFLNNFDGTGYIDTVQAGATAFVYATTNNPSLNSGWFCQYAGTSIPGRNDKFTFSGGNLSLTVAGSGTGLITFPATIDTGVTLAAAQALTNKTISGSSNTLSNVPQSAVTDLTTSLSGKEPTVTAGTTAQYYRGDKTFQTLNADAVPDGTTNKAFTEAEKTKLTGIAISATANSSDATLLSRANHTGTQLAATISDFSTAADARVTAGITGKEDTANKGIANGYASLDSGGKVPIGQLPSSIMEYQGVWNASTNTSPTLANGTGNTGDVYRVSVAGTALGLTFGVGDYVIYNGSVWEKSDTTDAVATVAGRTGDITLTAADVGGTVAVGNGGTGTTTLTANNVLLGNGTSAVQVVAPGTTGNVLTSNGTTWTSSAPTGGGAGETFNPFLLMGS